VTAAQVHARLAQLREWSESGRGADLAELDAGGRAAPLLAARGLPRARLDLGASRSSSLILMLITTTVDNSRQLQ
jgi:hypothetical protein